jgi:hypothetical protein
MQYFVHHPEEWERLRQSIDEAESSDKRKGESEGPVALDLAFKVPYIERVINESLRVMSMLSSNLERTVSIAGLALPNGIWLPPGTNVAINRSAKTRRKDNYPLSHLKNHHTQNSCSHTIFFPFPYLNSAITPSCHASYASPAPNAVENHPNHPSTQARS